MWRGSGGVCCLLEVPQGCSCQVNILQCTLEGVGVEVCSTGLLFGGKNCIYNSCERWIFVCICVGGWILFGCVRV